MKAVIFCIIVLISNGICQEHPDMAPSEEFPSETLRCCVCRAIVDEFVEAIAAVDPKKKVETGVGRMDANGNINSKVVKYARSETHLNDLIDTVCQEFKDYIQARDKITREVTIIRIMSRNGGMNPKFGEVDIVPDDDLNKRLKFYCEYIVENYEDDLLAVFSAKNSESKSDFVKGLCVKRTQQCQMKQLRRDEL